MNFQSSDVNSLLKEALERTTGQIRTADRVVFMLQEGRQLAIKAAHGGRPGKSLPAEKLSRAILRRVRRTGRTLFLADALEDSGLGARQSIQEIGQRSVICAPLKANGRVVGLMYADTVSMIAAFTPAHLRWVNQMTESLNEHLEPLISRHMETILDERMVGAEEEVELTITPLVAEANPIQQVLEGGVGSGLPGLTFQDPKPIHYKHSDKTRRTRAPKDIFESQLSLQELASFYRGFASMLLAGITVHRALDVLSAQDSPSAPIAKELHDRIMAGHRLSSSMKKFPRVFNSVHCSLVRIGEETGCLDILSGSLADHVESRMVLKGKIINALTYPVIVMAFCFLGCLAAPPLFLNDFFATLEGANAPLPWITQMVLALANVLWSPLLWVVLGLGAAVGYQCWKKLRSQRALVMAWEERLLEIPVLGEVRRSFFLLDFIQTLALQLESGMRLDKSLKLSAQVTNSPYFQDKTQWVVEQLNEGDSLSFSCRRAGLFPGVVVEFIALGEETGKMAESCRFAENLLRERAENALETAEALMEPISIALVGLLVGIVALACMLPLVRMFEAFA